MLVNRAILPILVIIFSFTSLPSFAGQLFTEFPEKIDPKAKYVFYSHGYIVEGTNPTPEHPKFGTYQFPDIKKALTMSNFNLIAYHRPAKTNPQKFAIKLANDVRALIKGGVDASQITLLGFSRGGAITAFASSNLSMEKLNTIMMASCGGWIKNRPEVKLAGNVLSIYETSDSFSTCKKLIERSEKVKSFQEIAISTGKQHGAFFTPRKEWLDPVLEWINSDKNK